MRIPRPDGTRERADPGQELTIVPANEASWEDLQEILGTADYSASANCQRFKVAGWIWRDSTQEARTAMLLEQATCGDPGTASTTGLVAHLGHEPVGWVAVEPRAAYPSCVPRASRGAVARGSEVYVGTR